MTEHNDKSGSPLPPSKTTPNHDSNRNSHWRDELQTKINDLDNQLVYIHHSQCFYHEAMVNLLTSENEPDSDTLAGAMVTQRWLQDSTQDILNHMDHIQHWLEALNLGQHP